MKHLKKVLALCAIVVLVIAAIFALPACKGDPTVESITVEITGGGEVVEIEQQSATVETIIGKITVVAVYSDETTKTITDYTVEDFDATKLDAVQTVTVKYGELTAPLSVKVKSTPVEVTDITVTLEGGGDKVTMTKATASEQALKGMITVKAVKSNNTNQVVTDYKVEGLDLNKVNQDQTVTIKYGNFSKTVKVLITEPVVTEITVTHEGEGEKVTMPKANASEEALKALLTVTAVKSDTTTEPVTEYEVEGLDTTKVNQDQTVTIKYGELTKTITVYITAPVVTVTGITVEPDGEKVTLTAPATEAALKALLTVTAGKSNGTTEEVTDYTVEGFDIDKVGEEQTVKIKYDTFVKTITVEITEATVDPPESDVKVTAITVTHEGDVVTLQSTVASVNALKALLTVTATMSDDTTKPVTEYEVEGLVLSKVNENQTVTIKYSGASKEITVYIEDDSVAPTEGVYISVNGGAYVELTENPKKDGEYMLLNKTLSEGDKVVITSDGEPVGYRTGCKFNGTVYLDGNYNFYVDENGIWVDDWVQISVKHGNDVSPVTVELDDPDDLDQKFNKQYVAVANLLEGDEISVKDIGNNVIGYENKTVFNGTASNNGTYKFYIKLGKNSADDIVYTEYTAAKVEALSTNVEEGETLYLYGVQADNINAKLTVTATWNVGEASIVTTYTVEDYDKTASGVQTVTISYGGKSVEIKVEVKEATVTEITATLKAGEVIELIGKNATTENILKSITVTADYNDGTHETVTAEVNESTFNATKYGETQTVEICHGEAKTNVPVKVIEATPSELKSDKQTVTVTSADDNTVIASIKSKIKVSVVMTDGDENVITDYTLELVKDNGNIVSATIKYGQLTKTITVTVTQAEPASISVTESEIEILESTSENAIISTIKGKLHVTLTMTDSSKIENTDDYDVNLGSFSLSNYEAQTITVSHGDLTSDAITVTVIAVPKIAKNNGEATFMTPGAENTYSHNVELERDNTVAITWKGEPLTLSGDFNGTAVRVGTYSFTVTVDGATATVETTLPAYAVELKVGDAKQNPTSVAGGVYTWQLTLKVGDKVTASDNQSTNSIDYTATRSGVHTFTVTQTGTTTTFEEAHPDYTVILTVKRNGETVDTKTESNIDNGNTDGRFDQYTISLELQKGDVVEITDNESNTHDTYKWCDFNGTAPRNGNYTFNVKIAKNSDISNEVYVAVPAKVVTISVNGTSQPLTLDTAKNEYVLKGLELKANDVVVIKVDGDDDNNYEDTWEHFGKDGDDYKAKIDGTYDFYVKDNGIYVAYHAPEVQGTVVKIKVNGVEIDELTYDTGKGEYVYEGLMLQAGDTVTIEKNGEPCAWRNSAAFNGTASATGYHDFYLNDVGVWVTTAYKAVYFYAQNDTKENNREEFNAYLWVDGGENNGWGDGQKVDILGTVGWHLVKVDVKYNRIILRYENNHDWKAHSDDIVLEGAYEYYFTVPGGPDSASGTTTAKP